MFTQCTNCQAIFRVSMREVTVSKGFLRCGECQQVFNSSKNLSTTMQEPFVAVDISDKSKTGSLSSDSLQTISALDDWQSSASADPTTNQINLRQSPTKAPIQVDTASNNKSHTFSTKGTESYTSSSGFLQKVKNILLLLTVSFLAILLILQIAFNYRHLFLDTLKYEPEKIQMLNHNVFAHPIEKDVLLISASIENTADFDQSFPVLEVRLTNSKGELVALRRFKPNEYLDNYSATKLLTRNKATSIKLKIKDPGNQAKRFQFNFL